MSRIEKAIEKAALLRKVAETLPTEVDNRSPIQPDTFRGIEPLKVDNPYLVTACKENVPASEEYRKLKAVIGRMTNGEKFNNTLMVASAVGGEGKTLTALNLAITLGQGHDHTVLLVDTDLRKPSVHEYLGIDPKVGLLQCLTEGLPISRALIKTGIGKLVVLPAGGRVANPVELLSSNKMKDLTKELKYRYPDRYVIFDTPPLLPFAEAQVIGSWVDGVVFVVREGYAKSQHVKEAMESLKERVILGVVFNGASFSPQKNRYHYHYY
jgi:protein-tyrosine kinase